MKDYVSGIVEDGTYRNVSEALRKHIETSLARGGSNSSEDVLASVDAHLNSLDGVKN